MSTKLPIDDEERNLWAQVIRGLYGIIRICVHYAKDGWTTGCPTNDLRACAKQLVELADWADANGITDPNQPCYDTPRPKCPEPNKQ